MATAQSLRRVPWTCRWGRFGGPVKAAGVATQGFVFWVCGHPHETGAPRPLDRGACESCPRWEAVNEVRKTG
jgi:hypothetical protein